MSRAFVREPDADMPPAKLPELPVSAGPNPVTARGLTLMDAMIASLELQLAEAAPDPESVPRLKRDLRYWTARRASAQLTKPSSGDEVAFGSRVKVDWPGRGQVTLQIVGEDESDPAHGRISWRAPVAAALVGNRVGDVVTVSLGGGAVELTIWDLT